MRVAGFEPAIFCSQGKWVKPLPYTHKTEVRAASVGLAFYQLSSMVILSA